MDSPKSNNNAVRGNVLVLLSGGIDSTACIAYYLSLGYVVSALFVDYGQPSADLEQAAANSIAKYYGVALKQITVSGCRIPEGYVPSRNAMLLSLALMTLEFQRGIVSIGVHAGTSYADCSADFEQAMQRVFDLYEQGRIRIDAPFLKWTKSEIWDFAKLNSLPLHLTHSTNLADLQPVSDFLKRG